MATIESVQINEFKSIVETKVKVEPNTTVLVGPNEAGKTSFLEVIEKFQYRSEFNASDLCRYGGTSDEIAKSEKPMVSVKFSGIIPSNLVPIYRFDTKFFQLDKRMSATINKYFDGTYSIDVGEFSDILNEEKRDRKKTVEDVASGINEILLPLLRNADGRRQEVRNAQRKIEMVQHKPDLIKKDKYHAVMDAINISKNVLNDIHSQEAFDVSDEYDKLERLEAKLSTEGRPIAEIVADHLFNPSFVKELSTLSNGLEFEELKGNSSTKYNELLSSLGISPDSLEGLNPIERRRKIKENTEKFSDQFFKFWQQEHINFDLDVANNEVNLIVSGSGDSEQLTQQRSRGFQHFLSFFIDFMASSENDQVENQIILLDDPGLHLHPERQKDLRRALDKLAQNNQVIYSTHSPFMIDTSEINSVRIVERESEEKGTKINSNISLSRDLKEDSFEPIRGALGATFADSLFASKRNVLVEGYTDRLYLTRISKLFHNAEDKPSLDHDVSIIDMSGGDNWPKYTRILEAEGYDYALTLDYDGEDDTTEQDVKDDKYVNQKHIITLDDIADDEIEEEDKVEVEGLFDIEFYCRQVTDYYDEIEVEHLIGELEEDERKREEALEHRFNQLRGEINYRGDDFNKSDIADHIDKQLRDSNIGLDDLGEETVRNFTSLINKINSILRGEFNNEAEEEETEAVA